MCMAYHSAACRFICKWIFYCVSCLCNSFINNCCIILWSSLCRIQAVSIDSSSFWSDGVILRSSNHLQKPVVPCFLQDFVQQIFSAGKSVELTQGLGKVIKSISLP